MNMKPGGRSKRPAPLPPSTVPFTVAAKVSTTTAGREVWGREPRSARTAGSREGRARVQGKGRCQCLSTGRTRGGSHGKGRPAPCHLTEAASPAAVSPRSWAPAAGWVPPATSGASTGCNTNMPGAGSDTGLGTATRKGAGRAAPRWPLAGQGPIRVQGAPEERPGPGTEQLEEVLAGTDTSDASDAWRRSPAQAPEHRPHPSLTGPAIRAPDLAMPGFQLPLPSGRAWLSLRAPVLRGQHTLVPAQTLPRGPSSPRPTLDTCFLSRGSTAPGTTWGPTRGKGGTTHRLRLTWASSQGPTTPSPRVG